jgi:hypothetical protein
VTTACQKAFSDKKPATGGWISCLFRWFLMPTEEENSMITCGYHGVVLAENAARPNRNEGGDAEEQPSVLAENAARPNRNQCLDQDAQRIVLAENAARPNRNDQVAQEAQQAILAENAARPNRNGET